MDLTLLRLSSALAAHAMARQTVVTENIAHADTPGYRARDLPDFAETMSGISTFVARSTRPGHSDFDVSADRYGAEDIAALGAETPNGNSVSLEDQMIRAAELRQSHDLALGVYGKTMDILRASIGKQR